MKEEGYDVVRWVGVGTSHQDYSILAKTNKGNPW